MESQLPRILCVDDDPGVLEALRSMLGGRFDVTTALSGGAALTVLQAREPFCVVVTDYYMEDMNGADFLKRARMVAPQTTRILLTGHANLDAVINAVNEGYIFRVLVKPCDIDTLTRAIDMATEHYRLVTADHDLMAHKVEEISQRLLHAERLASLGTMATGIGHELNNATTVFLSLLAEIKARAAEGLPAEAIDLDELTQVGEHFRLHGTHLLRLGRPGSERVVPTDLGPVVSDTLHMLRTVGKLKHVDVKLFLAAEPVTVPVDARRIEQVLVNLIVNAADAMQDVRYPVLTVGLSQDPAAGQARLTIEDNGSGIAPSQLDVIFEPYFTTKPADRGTGLGLPVVRQILQGYGGSISVHSQIDKGTTFTCVLPVVNA